MSDLLPAILFCLSLCVAVGTFTNRTFGHATFFRCQDGCADAMDTLARQSDSNVKSSNNSCGSGIREERTETKSLRIVRAENSEISRADVAAGDERHTCTLKNTGVNDRNVFFSEAPLSVLEHVGSFLFPAELVDVAPVSVDFSRTIAESGVVWREQCSRAFGGGGKGRGCLEHEAHGSTVIAVGEGWLEETLSRHANLSVPCRGVETESAATKRAPAAADGCIFEVSAARDDVDHDNDVHSSATGSTMHDRKTSVSQDRGVGHVDRGEKKPRSRDVGSVAFDAYYCSGGTRSPSRQQQLEQRQLSSPPSSSRAWKAAFFHAHSTRAHQMLEEGKIIHSNAAATSASTAAHLDNANTPSSSSLSSYLLVIVGDKVHDLTEFRDSHPGGALILQEYAFTDATHAFERFFHSREARRIARQFVVWDSAAVMGRSGTLWKYSENEAHLKRALGGATADNRDGEQTDGATGPVLSSSGARALHQAIRRWTTAR
ncbi:unnamed protein product [Sphacelaria rigidula]